MGTIESTKFKVKSGGREVDLININHEAQPFSSLKLGFTSETLIEGVGDVLERHGMKMGRQEVVWFLFAALDGNFVRLFLSKLVKQERILNSSDIRALKRAIRGASYV